MCNGSSCKNTNCNCRKTPNKWAKEIKAWADGATIQYYDRNMNYWVTLASPVWEDKIDYRIKPTIVKRWQWVGKTSKDIEWKELTALRTEEEAKLYYSFVGRDWHMHKLDFTEVTEELQLLSSTHGRKP